MRARTMAVLVALVGVPGAGCGLIFGFHDPSPPGTGGSSTTSQASTTSSHGGMGGMGGSGGAGTTGGAGGATTGSTGGSGGSGGSTSSAMTSSGGGCMTKGCPPQTPCVSYTCNPSTMQCDPTYVTAGTPVGAPMNCIQERCDGMGAMVPAPDPTQDGKPCTNGECHGGACVSGCFDSAFCSSTNSLACCCAVKGQPPPGMCALSATCILGNHCL